MIVGRIEGMDEKDASEVSFFVFMRYNHEFFELGSTYY